MLIPVRCFSCGKVIGNKYLEYQKLLSEKNKKECYKDDQDDRIDNQEIFKKLKLKKYCCRRMLLTHVSLVEILKD